MIQSDIWAWLGITDENTFDVPLKFSDLEHISNKNKTKDIESYLI